MMDLTRTLDTLRATRDRYAAAVAALEALTGAENGTTPQNTPAVKPRPVAVRTELAQEAKTGGGPLPTGGGATVRAAQGKSGGFTKPFIGPNAKRPERVGKPKAKPGELGETMRRVYEAVKAIPAGQSIRTMGVRERTGLCRRDVGNCLHRLAMRGLVQSVAYGEWQATRKPAPPLDDREVVGVAWDGTRERQGQAPSLSSVGRA